MSTDVTHLPDWLRPTRRQPSVIDLEKTRFDMVFESVIAEMSKGRFLSSAVRDFSEIDIDYGRFLAWIRRDPTRWAAYTEAQQIGGEMILAKTMDRELENEQVIPEDVQVARLNFDKAKWYLQVVDRRRFGASQQVSGDPDNPLELKVVHAIARSALDEYTPTALDGTAVKVLDAPSGD